MSKYVAKQQAFRHLNAALVLLQRSGHTDEAVIWRCEDAISDLLRMLENENIRVPQPEDSDWNPCA